MKTTSALKHILLIEPDPVQADMISQTLQSSVHHVHHAVGAQAAIAEADATMPDLVILELALPAHNGIEFLHEFRSYQEWTGIPVLIFTQQQVDERTVFQTLGDVTYLYKPVTSLAELKNRVTAIIQ